MKTYLFSFVTFISIISCSSSVDVAIDNPTEQSITLKIDSLEVEVPAKEMVWVEMGKGEHNIILENNAKEKFNFQESTYMLNPTMSEYLLTEEFYGSEMWEKSAQNKIPKQKVNFLGIELEGNFEVIKKLINPIKWEYGPREVLPEIVDVDSEENYTLLTKLYDQQEVIKMFKAYEASVNLKEGEMRPVTAEEIIK